MITLSNGDELESPARLASGPVALQDHADMSITDHKPLPGVKDDAHGRKSRTKGTLSAEEHCARHLTHPAKGNARALEVHTTLPPAKRGMSRMAPSGESAF